MSTGLIILSRYASERLPGKALLDVGGRTVLGHIVDRLRRGAPEYPIVVATSTDPNDDPIVQWCRRSGIDCFRGALEDVSDRFLSCAEQYGWHYAVRINGDNIFTDPGTLRAMLAIAATGHYDLVTNVPGRTFPYGMSVEIVRTSFLRSVMARIENAADREHVTKYLYDHPDVGIRYIFKNTAVPSVAGLQLALDTPEDLLRCERIISSMSRYPSICGLADMPALIREEQYQNPWRGRHGPLLIAEIGGNHEGDYEAAQRLTELAVSTGVDYVKFQLYRGDSLVNPIESPDQNAHFKRFELTPDQHIALAQMCLDGGVGYLASVWDLEMLDWIDEHLRIYKIGSGDLTAWPLVREFVRRGKPIILATGLATLDEVMQTVAQIQALDDRYNHPEWLALLQCTSMYPVEPRDANLRVMDTLRKATGLAVGYSDHTEKGLALRVAAAMGAQILEFHFTDSREGKTFRDHKVSLMPAEVMSLQEDCDNISLLRGDGMKRPMPSEVQAGHVSSFRRAVYPATDIEAGSCIGAKDLKCLRPDHGIDARDYSRVLGHRLRRDKRAHERLSWDDLM